MRSRYVPSQTVRLSSLRNRTVSPSTNRYITILIEVCSFRTVCSYGTISRGTFFMRGTTTYRLAIWCAALFGMAAHAAAFASDAAAQTRGRKVTQQAKSRTGGRRPARSGTSPASVLTSRFDRESPQIGDPLPEVSGVDSDGNVFPLANLKGQYTVLVFGCLT